ncbi:MAG: hypothetical protein DRN04_12465 [Thermoprotei archaeon]|nr:MAG: hypothetical protein DRN04_12465 [Thermoprotei archaeon]
MRKVLALFLTGLILIIFFKVETIATSSQEIHVMKKVEYYCILGLNGKIEEWKVDVEITIEGTGFRTIVDRIWFVSPQDILEISPKPSSIKYYGRYLKLIWERLKLPTNIKYSARLFTPPPINYSVEISVNGRRAEIIERNGVDYVKVEVGEIVSLNITLVNTKKRWLCENSYLRLPLNLIIMFNFPSYLKPLSLSPQPNSTIMIGDERMHVWMITLYNNISLSFKAKVEEVNPWGEVPLKRISIQVIDRPDLVAERVEEIMNRLNEYIEGLSSIVSKMKEGINASLKLAEGLANISTVLNNTGYSLLKISSVLKDSGENLIKASEEMKSLIKSFKGSISYASATLNKISEVLKALESSEVDYNEVISSLEEAIDTLKKIYPQNETIIQLLEGLKTLIEQLSQNQEELFEEVEKLKKMVSSINRAIEEGEEAADKLKEAGQGFVKLSSSINLIGYTNINLSLVLYNISETLVRTVNSSLKQLSTMENKLNNLTETKDHLEKIRKCAYAEWNLYYKYSLEILSESAEQKPKIEIVAINNTVKGIVVKTENTIYGLVIKSSSKIIVATSENKTVSEEASIYTMETSVLICPLSNGSVLRNAVDTKIILLNVSNPSVELDVCKSPVDAEYSTAFSLELVLPRLFSVKEFVPTGYHKGETTEEATGKNIVLITVSALSIIAILYIAIKARKHEKIEVDITDILEEIEEIRREVSKRAKT